MGGWAALAPASWPNNNEAKKSIIGNISFCQGAVVLGSVVGL
jgi:hypothetical protein